MEDIGLNAFMMLSHVLSIEARVMHAPILQVQALAPLHCTVPCSLTVVCPRQVVLVTSIGTDEFFFPLNLLWCAQQSQATTATTVPLYLL